MSEFIGLENMSSKWGPPEWREYWGPEFHPDHSIFDNIFWNTLDQPLEERNKLLKLAKEEVVSLRNRWRYLTDEEVIEAWALCSKYNHPETGLFPRLISDYETRMADLRTRLPDLARWIDMTESKESPLMSWQRMKLFTGNADKGRPTVVFNHGWTLPPDEIAPQGIEAVKNHLIKKTTLLEEQTQILISALEDNGVQIPPKSADIQSQINALKRPQEISPDKPDPGQKTGQQRDERRARPVTLIEEPSGSSFKVVYEDPKKPEPFDPMTYIHPPRPARPPRDMDGPQMEELLKSMHRFKCGKVFEKLSNEEKPSKYLAVVRDHRDLVTIKTAIANPKYLAKNFFEDIRLMLDNYSHYFGEGSEEHKMAERFQEAMFKKLEDYGEEGQTAKDQFNNAPRAQFNEIISSPKADETNDIISSPKADETNNIISSPKADETNDIISFPMADDTIQLSEEHDRIDDSDDPDEAETSFAQGINYNYDEEYGDERDDGYFGRDDDILDCGNDGGSVLQTPGTAGPAKQAGAQGGHMIQSPSTGSRAEQSEDGNDPINRAWGGFYAAKEYNQTYGNATRAPAGHGTAQPQNDEDGRPSPPPAASGTAAQSEVQDDQDPSGRPSPDTDKPADQTEEFSMLNPYSSSPRAPGPVEQRDDKDSDILSSIASPSPYPPAPLEAPARDFGDEDAHAGAYDSEQPAPVAPMHAEQEIIDLTLSPPPQASHIDSASTKRARGSDDQDSSSDDDAPLIKRRKTATDSTLYAVTPSLGKRSRDDSDDDDNEEREQPSKRSKASPIPEQLQAPVAAATAGEIGLEHRSLTIDELFEPFQSSQPPVQEPPPPVAAAAQVGQPSPVNYRNLSRIINNVLIPESPIPEPLTPTAAAADGPGSVSPPPMLDAPDTEGHESKAPSSSPSAAAEEPQPEPATEGLGHTNNGTVTASKLHKLAKYKKKGRSNERGRPARPWVFGYQFGDEYGLYIMSCPTRGCETGSEVFTTHPLTHNDAAAHLRECGHDFNDIDDMVRKYCTQVVSDEKKIVSIEWARNWNKELMKEYGDEDRENENF